MRHREIACVKCGFSVGFGLFGCCLNGFFLTEPFCTNFLLGLSGRASSCVESLALFMWSLDSNLEMSLAGHFLVVCMRIIVILRTYGLMFPCLHNNNNN